MTTGQVHGVMDEDTYRLIVLVYFVITLIISPLGIILNIINIVVFCKLGFKESTNIILVSLAVVDTFILLTLLGLSVTSTLTTLGVVTCDVMASVTYIILGWPNVTTLRISGCLTTYLTFERFLCVVLPLRVKTILQKKTALTFIIALCVFTIAYSFPIFMTNSIGLRFNPMSNQTSVGLIVAENSDVLEGVARISSTANIFVYLKMSSKFRNAFMEIFPFGNHGICN
ncbi:uncharacterized protein LOC131954036 [Physella acuta]|uniref:uncharacterized protein LOC131954036 n=1 Tax=Physella acuta TaxID=109671 RepID=UPI0027DD7482|nr:uncharacterized protein LOC131954036 [Physella acuta]